MKYFAGMFLPSLVCAELGKNFPLRPSPSPSIVPVDIGGLTNRLLFSQTTLRVPKEPPAIPAISRASVAKLAAAPANPLPSQRLRVSQEVATSKTPATQRAMCK